MPGSYVPELSNADRQSRRRKIAAHVRRNRDIDAAARHFSVSETTVRNSCREYRVAIPPREPATRKLSKTDIVAIVAEILSGNSIHAIAEIFGVSHELISVVRREMAEYEIFDVEAVKELADERRRKERELEARNSAIAEACGKGMLVADAAEKFGVSQSIVLKVIAAAGLTPNDAKKFRVVKRLAAGEHFAEAAEAEGVHVNTVRRMAEEILGPLRELHDRRQLDDGKKYRILVGLVNGQGQKEIAEEEGVNAKTVRGVRDEAERAGIVFR